jgi:hypothetical protein
LVGVVLRGIPELLVSQYPIGYETITWYAPVIMTFYGRSLIDIFASTFKVGPLFYILMWLVANVSGASAFLILKATGPLLYGGLAFSFFLFLRQGLKLDGKMAFVAALLMVFQVAALRESWDRFRNVLGLIFVFAALTTLKSDREFKWPLVAGLAVLTTLSRDYISLVLFVAVLGFAVLERKNMVVSLVALAPALAVFYVMSFPRQLLSNYVSSGQSAASSYLWTVQDALTIFAVCYLLLLPFVVKGFKRDNLLDPMLGLLLIGSFSFIAIPWFAVPGYQCWLILLVFPFSIYAVKGFERFRLFEKGNFRKLVAVLLAFMVIGIGYSTGVFSYVPPTNSWVPTSLVQSSIGWNQINDVKGVLTWLNENATYNSSILAEERFYGLTLIYFGRANKDITVIPYGANSAPTLALNTALSDGFSCIYLIWYTNSSLENFQMVHSQNSISIFQYKP